MKPVFGEYPHILMIFFEWVRPIPYSTDRCLCNLVQELNPFCDIRTASELNAEAPIKPHTRLAEGGRERPAPAIPLL